MQEKKKKPPHFYFLFVYLHMKKGRVIIKFNDNHLESFRCKSKERAKEIADNRKSVKEWDYYPDGERIPEPTKKKIVDRNYNEKFYMALMRQEGLI